MPWLSLATAFLKLSGALMDYAERKNFIKQGELQAFQKAAQTLSSKVRESRKAIVRGRVDIGFRDRLRDKYSRRKRVLPDSSDPPEPPTG